MEFKDYYKIMGVERDATQDENGQTIPGSPETIPPHYNAASTLTFTVEPGKNNDTNFDLVSTGAGAPGQ